MDASSTSPTGATGSSTAPTRSSSKARMTRRRRRRSPSSAPPWAPSPSLPVPKTSSFNKLSSVTTLLLALGLFLPAHAATADRFAAADQAFRERKDPERAREALRLYREYYKETPDDPEAGWRLGFACYFTGIRLTPDK